MGYVVVLAFVLAFILAAPVLNISISVCSLDKLS